MDVIKTLPENVLTLARGEFANAGTVAAQAFARADVERTRIIQRLLDFAVSEGVAPKVAVPDIMAAVVKPCTLTKAEQADGLTPYTTGKLAYSTGAAYAKSMELAMLKGKPFAVGLYAAHLKEAQGKREADHAAKVIAAEQAAKVAQEKADAAIKKAARSKSAEVKIAAEEARKEAEKAQRAARTVIDTTTSKKTGGKVSAKTPTVTKALTRHEVAMHATALVAMLRSIGETDAAEGIAEVLSDNNLLVSK